MDRTLGAPLDKNRPIQGIGGSPDVQEGPQDPATAPESEAALRNAEMPEPVSAGVRIPTPSVAARAVRDVRKPARGNRDVWRRQAL